MAKFVFTDAKILINAVDMSAMADEVSIELEVDSLDSTTFGAGWRSKLGGLKAGNVGIKFKQDFAAAQVDATIWPLLGTVTTFEIRPTSAARSATNPAYTGTLLVDKFTPITGSVGDLAETGVSWPTTGVVQRQTS